MTLKRDTCGTYARYLFGCRCDACRAAGAAYIRNRRQVDPAVRTRDNVKHKAARKADPVKARNKSFKRKRGITLAERDAMLRLQGGMCDICKTPDFGKRGPQMDHDHDTGRLRRVLCTACNVGLGAFGDDPGTLRTAAIYIEHHRHVWTPGLGAGLL